MLIEAGGQILQLILRVVVATAVGGLFTLKVMAMTYDWRHEVFFGIDDVWSVSYIDLMYPTLYASVYLGANVLLGGLCPCLRPRWDAMKALHRITHVSWVTVASWMIFLDVFVDLRDPTHPFSVG